jgi:hypothetical protein
LLVGEADDQVDDGGAAFVVEGAGGFVHQEEGGIVHQSAGTVDALALAAGELVGAAAGLVRQANRVEEFEGAVRALAGLRPSIWAMTWSCSAAVREGGRQVGLLENVGLRGPWSSAKFAVVRLTNDQILENATGVDAPPPTWPRSELAVDLLHKSVYALSPAPSPTLWLPALDWAPGSGTPRFAARMSTAGRRAGAACRRTSASQCHCRTVARVPRASAASVGRRRYIVHTKL